MALSVPRSELNGNHSTVQFTDAKAEGLVERKVTTHLSDVHPMQPFGIRTNKELIRQEIATAKLLGGGGLPQRMFMELSSSAKIGHLPGIPRSNLMMDQLLGLDDEIVLEDVLNPAEFDEKIVNIAHLTDKGA